MDEKKRPDPLTERLDACYTGALHDVMRAAGLERFTLPPEIRPSDPESRLCGPVWTVSGVVDAHADSHRTLFEWTGLLSKAPAGHVVICQPNDSLVAHMGELSARTWQSRGIRGYIVDGGWLGASIGWGGVRYVLLSYARARGSPGLRSDCYSTWLERRRMATALLKSGHP